MDLAPLTDPSLVPAAVAAALGVSEIPGRSLPDTLAEHLETGTTLVILDNCEHLVDAASRLVDRLLRRAVDLRVIATSREALGVPGELAWRVPSLSAPDREAARTAASAGRFEAVQLFCDRAAAQRPGFALTDDNADVIGHICRRLDGVPLAIELAAARVKVLAPDDLLARLEDRFLVLTGGSRTALPRQQTLRATVDWSHDLLGDAERVLFRRLSVFAGGFDLDACEAVCGTDLLADEPVLDLLGGLVDKSLVIAEGTRAAGCAIPSSRPCVSTATRSSWARARPPRSATPTWAGSSTWPSAPMPAGSTPRAPGSPGWSAMSTTSGRPSIGRGPSIRRPSCDWPGRCRGSGTSTRSTVRRVAPASRMPWPGVTSGPPSWPGRCRARR